MWRPMEPRAGIQSDHVASMKRKNGSRSAGAPHPPSLPWHTYLTVVGEFHCNLAEIREELEWKKFLTSPVVARNGVAGGADCALALGPGSTLNLDYSITVIFLSGNQRAMPCGQLHMLKAWF